MSKTTDTGSIPKKDLSSILDLEPMVSDTNSHPGEENQALPDQIIESVDDFPTLESEPYVAEAVAELITEEKIEEVKVIPDVILDATPAELPETELKNDFSKLREFADNLPIGNPTLEANPPYSLFATGNFSEKQKEEILGIMNDLQLGILSRDLTVQLEMGRLLIPQISEYVAILIAQKIKDLCEEVRIGPSAKIYQN